MRAGTFRLQRGRWQRLAAGLCVLALWSVTPVWADTVDVTVKGVEDELLSNVQGTLSILEEDDKNMSEDKIRRLYRVGRSQARQALAPFGFYNPEIHATLTPPADDGTQWRAVYAITAGPPTTVTQLDLRVTGPGKDNPALQNVLAASHLHDGDTLHHADYKATKSALSSAAYRAGYLDARFTRSAVRVNPDDNTAQIELVLATGERYYFDRISIDQDFLEPSFARKFVPIRPGEPYDANRLIDLQLILSDTDYFRRVTIDAEPDKASRATAMPPWFRQLLWPDTPLLGDGELRVPVTVHVEPSKPRHYRISAGYGTDTGPRVGFGVKFRHLNDRGHQFSLDTRISQIERTLHASYDIPIRDVVHDRFSIVGTLSNQEFGDVTSNLAQVGIVRDTGWTLGRNQPYIKAQFESYDLDDGAGNRNAFFVYPGYTWTLRRVDDAMQIRKGVSLDFDIRGTGTFLGSDTDFVRAKLTGGLIRPLTDRTRLLLRGAVGAMSADDFKYVPPSQRFFAGGGSSVRGYSYQGLSPRNNGTRVGGRYLAVGSVEADYRFYKKFYVATFYDIGNAADHWDMDFKRGAGIGFRWASPVGMIRLDFAHPLDDPNSNFRIHFSLGPAL